MSLTALMECAGVWHGTNVLQDPHIGAPVESVSTAIVTPVLGGKFVRMDYTWSYGDAEQEGVILFGFEKKEHKLSAYWIDSWHMGDKAMVCSGEAQESGALSVRGSYAAPPGPDWGWRIDLFPAEGVSMKMLMYNIWPEGREDIAVETVYRRV